MKTKIIKDLSLTQDKILELIVDSTEFDIQRPKDKKENQRMRRKRIKIEHAFKGLKVFRYLRDKCRNFIEETFDKRFDVIIGLINLKNSLKVGIEFQQFK